LFRVKLLLVRLEVYINIILLRFGYIPEVAEKCHEILDVINSNRQWDFPIICDIVESIYNQIQDILNYLIDLSTEYRHDPIIHSIILFFYYRVEYIDTLVCGLYFHVLGCE